ncbi:MAG: NADH-quinone oxidoreductase subunit A [Candidatus Njordarchaeia archaeon]
MYYTASYIDLGIFLILGLVLFALAIIINRIIGAGGPLSLVINRSFKKNVYKKVSYECTEIPVGEQRFRFDIEYYIFPLVFLVFDVFTAFLFLWGVSYNPGLNAPNIIILSLILILTIGLITALLKDGQFLMKPLYDTPKIRELIEKAAEGDEEAINEFLRIEPLTIYKDKPAIEQTGSKGLEKKDPVELLHFIQEENMKMYVDPESGGSVIITSIRNLLRKGLGWLINWGVAKSPWIPHLGIKCCSIEIPYAVGVSRFDMERFGVAPSGAPRQTDVLIVNGPITKKFAARIKVLYDQMPEPKFVIALGECAIVGGPFKGTYSLVEGVNKILPVDLYIPGCPPRPEAFLEALIHFRSIVDKRKLDLGTFEGAKVLKEELKDKVEKILKEF